MSINILHVSAVQNWGGGENHLENLCDELSDKDVSSSIFCAKDSTLHKRLLQKNFPIFTAPLKNKLDPRYVLNLIQLCRKEKFDLLHIHDSTALTLAVIADHFYELPPFILSKKTSFPIRGRRQTLYKYNYPKLRKILCVSRATSNISATAIDNAQRLEVIYHGTQIEQNKAISKPDLRKILPIPDSAVIVGNIANHIEAKDLFTFVRTAHYLVHEKQKQQFCFVQIGNFSRITPSLKKLVNDLNLEEHVFFLGFVEGASHIIPQFDISLITSEIEGIPQVIYESFLQEVPVVSTDVGGIAEAIENGHNGLLSEPHNPEALGENILLLIENPQLMATFVEISKRKLYQRFTSRIMAGETLEVYKNLIQ